MNGKTAMAIPFMEEGETQTLMALADSTKKTTYDQAHSPGKLIIYKDDNGHEKLERMYIKADSAYAKRKNYVFNDSDFSGMYWFEDSEDEFSRAYVYKNGKLIKEIQPRRGPSSKRTAEGCGEEFGTTIIMSYYSWASVQGYGTWGPRYMYSVSLFVDMIDYTNCTVSPSTVSAPSNSSWSGSPSDFNNSPNFTQWYNNLNSTEKAWVDANWTAAGLVFVNYMNAETLSRVYFSKNQPNALELMNPFLLPDVDGTNQNAFKHILAAALHAKYLGPSTAWTVVSNHELTTPNNILKEMDVANNGLGIAIANEHAGSEQSLIDAVYDFVAEKHGWRAIVNGVVQPQLVKTSSASNDQNY